MIKDFHNFFYKLSILINIVPGSTHTSEPKSEQMTLWKACASLWYCDVNEQTGLTSHVHPSCHLQSLPSSLGYLLALMTAEDCQ